MFGIVRDLRAQKYLISNFLGRKTMQPEETAAAEIIDAAIAEVGATSRKEMGQVMKIVQEKTAGRADGKTLSQAVMAKLG